MTSHDPKKDYWDDIEHAPLSSGKLAKFALTGIIIGLVTGTIISIFRITKKEAYDMLLRWLSPENRDATDILLWAIALALSALIVCRLIRDPAIRLDGFAWINRAMKNGQPHVWRKILAPKFAGIWLVLANGISVGSEGPSIQMGAALALGLKRFGPDHESERRYFVLAGCAAGLAAAFSAPLAGLCYVYEVMREKMSKPLLVFLLAAGCGIYLSCSQIFGLTVMVDLPTPQFPDLASLGIFLPLTIASAGTGMAYAFLLRFSLDQFQKQKKIPIDWLPMLAFAGAFFVMLFFPAISGEGLTIIRPIDADKTILSFLVVFIVAKLLFTAFCYGTFIPAGVMVPLLAVGGATGAVYFDILQIFHFTDIGYRPTCIAMGMAAAFAAAEHAPLTAFVLVAEMTNSWNIAITLLMAGALGFYMAKLCKCPHL